MQRERGEAMKTYCAKHEQYGPGPCEECMLDKEREHVAYLRGLEHAAKWCDERAKALLDENWDCSAEISLKIEARSKFYQETAQEIRALKERK